MKSDNSCPSSVKDLNRELVWCIQGTAKGSERLEWSEGWEEAYELGQRERQGPAQKGLVGKNSGFVSKGDRNISKGGFEQRNEKKCCVFFTRSLSGTRSVPWRLDMSGSKKARQGALVVVSFRHGGDLDLSDYNGTWWK